MCGAGGASLSLHSLMAAIMGAAACVPLVMLKAALWTNQARSRFPVVAEMQRWQTAAARPLLTDLSPLEVGPLLLMQAFALTDTSLHLSSCTKCQCAPVLPRNS